MVQCFDHFIDRQHPTRREPVSSVAVRARQSAGEARAEEVLAVPHAEVGEIDLQGASASIPIERAAKYMSHADIGNMYKHYLHLFSDDHTEEMTRLAAVASRQSASVTQIGS